MNEIPYGYCHCGCGHNTNLIKKTVKKLGLTKGEPRKYIRGHHIRGEGNMKWGKDQSGCLNPNWKGGRKLSTYGYIQIWKPEHPRADKNGCVFEHIIVAEEKYGGPFPKTYHVHHIDGNKINNNPDNLEICPNVKHHQLLHTQKRAIDACGNKDWRKCRICKKYDDPDKLYISTNGYDVYHKNCINSYQRYNRMKKLRYRIDQMNQLWQGKN